LTAEEQEDGTDEEDDPGLDESDEDDNLMSPASLIQLEDSVGPGNIFFVVGFYNGKRRNNRARRFVDYTTHLKWFLSSDLNSG
jgi:hypothetical protein